MPHYDLRCVECNTEHRISASIKEKTEKNIPCPDCGSFDLETVYTSGPAIIKNMKQTGCPNRSFCGSSGCQHAGR